MYSPRPSSSPTTRQKKKKSMHTTNPKITEIKSNIRQKTAPPPTLALKAGAVRWFGDLVKRSSGSNALQTEIWALEMLTRSYKS